MNFLLTADYNCAPIGREVFLRQGWVHACGRSFKADTEVSSLSVLHGVRRGLASGVHVFPEGSLHGAS